MRRLQRAVEGVGELKATCVFEQKEHCAFSLEIAQQVGAYWVVSKTTGFRRSEHGSDPRRTGNVARMDTGTVWISAIDCLAIFADWLNLALIKVWKDGIVVGLSGVKGQFLLDANSIVVRMRFVFPTFIQIPNSERKILHCDGIIGSRIDETELKLTFSGKGYSVVILEVDITKFTIAHISVHIIRVFTSNSPTV